MKDTPHKNNDKFVWILTGGKKSVQKKGNLQEKR